jgi:cell wall-associated NlpC family hydrolase
VNLVLALIIIGGGGLLMRSGIADPPGGIWGELGRLLRGEGLTAVGHGHFAADVGAVVQSAGDSLNSAAGSLLQQAGAGPGLAALNAARTQLGKPYRWGGADPSSGFDCSGLVQWSYAQAGVKLPRTSLEQSRVGHTVAQDAMAPGDLIFYGTPVHHVAIWAGAGKVVEAPTFGVPVHEVPMYMKDLSGIRRPY